MNRWMPTLFIIAIMLIPLLRKYFRLDEYLQLDKYPIVRIVVIGITFLIVIGSAWIVYAG